MVEKLRLVGIAIMIISLYSLVHTNYGGVVVEGYQMTVSPLFGYPMSVSSPKEKISPALEEKLSRASPEERIPVVVVLTANPGGMAVSQQNSVLPSLQMAGFQLSVSTSHVSNTLAGTIPARNIDSIAQNPQVSKVLYDIKIKLMPDSGLSVKLLKNSVKQIHADEVWAQGYTGQGVTVFEIDSGIQDNHPALMRGGKSLVIKQYDVDPSFGDYTTSHGTHVAGIIASQDPTYRGVAPGIRGFVDVVAFDSSGSGRLSWILKALEYVYNNADKYKPAVSTNSWGIFPDPASSEENEIRKAVLKLSEKIPVVFAAGNFGAPNTIAAPGDAASGRDEVITVAAVDKNGNVASFSSRGPVNTGVYSQDPNEPDVAAPGVGITSTIPSGFGTMSGTSMAAPHVAGVIALMLSKNPSLTNKQCLDILMATALDNGPVGYDYEYGAGIVQADKAVFSTEWTVIPSQSSPVWEVLSVVGIVAGSITIIRPEIIIGLVDRIGRWLGE